MSEHPVIVVGAGLAGLACAARLEAAGRGVVVLEAADAVGGRVRTDVIDGFRCDRGFQLLNPAYPVLPTVLDPVGGLAALDLKAFRAGVVVAHGGRHSVLADPRRVPSALPASLVGIGSPVEKLRFARWAARSLRPVPRLLAEPDRTLAADLDAARLTGPLRRAVIEPFLAGVLAEWEGATSATFAQLLVRAFVLGSPAVPSLGMGRLPELLASGLAPGTVRLGTPVRAVSAGTVRTDDGELPASAVVVAADPLTAAELTGLPRPVTKPLSTYWFTAPEPPSTTPMLHLDGDRDGPLVNAAVMTTVAPSYAPAGRPLIALSAVATDAGLEPVLRSQAARVFGTPTDRWQLVTRHVIEHALPAQPPGQPIRQPVRLPGGLYVAGDHRDTASIQGALVSGRQAAAAVLRELT